MHNIFKKITLSGLLILGLIASSTGQQNKPELDTDILKTGTTGEQFDFVLNNSKTYVNNKVVKIEWLKTIKKNAVLKEENLANEINALKEDVQSHSSTIKSLEDELKEVNLDLTSSNQKVENITFLGSEMTKSSFKFTFWIILGVISALLVFFVLKYKQSNSLTKEAKERLGDLEVAHEDLRKRKREKEQELMRKLQDEINKYS